MPSTTADRLIAQRREQGFDEKVADEAVLETVARIVSVVRRPLLREAA